MLVTCHLILEKLQQLGKLILSIKCAAVNMLE